MTNNLPYSDEQIKEFAKKFNETPEQTRVRLANNKFIPRDACELLNDDTPPPEYIIDGVIYEEGITQFYGDGGTFKSSLAIHYGSCFATGMDSFHHKTLKQGNVLYVDEENGERSFKHKLNTISKGMGVKPEDLKGKFFSLSIKGFIINEENMRKIKEIILIHDIKLLILDSLSKVIDGKENDSNDIVRMHYFLRELCEHFKISVLEVHHANKAGDDASKRFRGSGEILWHTNIGFEFKKYYKKGYKYTFNNVRNRDNKPLEAINFDIIETGDQLEIKYLGLASKNIKSNTLEAIKEYIRTSKKSIFKTAELKALVSKKQSRTVDRIIKSFYDLGIFTEEHKEGHHVLSPKFDKMFDNVDVDDKEEDE